MAGAGTGRSPCAVLTCPAPDVERRAREFVNAQEFEADGGADDVYDGIHSADFVEVHLLDRHLMNFGFRFGEAGENLARAVGGARRELGFIYAVENDGKSAVVMAFAGCDFHVRRENLAALHFFGGNRPAFEAQFAQFGFDGAQVGAGIHQGAQNHVAADAGEAIEIGVAQGFHRCFGLFPDEFEKTILVCAGNRVKCARLGNRLLEVP